MRVVLDTNVLISALWSDGSPPARLLAAWRAAAIELVMSVEQLAELADVLTRPKITKRIRRADASLLLGELRVRTVWVTDLPRVTASPDPDDNQILATAIAGAADLVVSGDRRGMRDLEVVQGIRIVSAREALGLLRLS